MQGEREGGMRMGIWSGWVPMPMPVQCKERRRAAVMEEYEYVYSEEEDMLFEVLKHLDPKSVAIAACVCRRWRRTAEEETLWEGICTRHVHCPLEGQVSCVVRALGGFRRLYVHCLRPLLARSNNKCAAAAFFGGLSKEQFNLSLSLFSIDCYERLGRRSGTAPTSLNFLCTKHNVTSYSASFPLQKATPALLLPPPPPPPPASTTSALLR